MHKHFEADVDTAPEPTAPRPRNSFAVLSGVDDVKIQKGKHSGRLVSEIAVADPDYLNWMLEELDHLSPELTRRVSVFAGRASVPTSSERLERRAATVLRNALKNAVTQAAEAKVALATAKARLSSAEALVVELTAMIEVEEENKKS